MYARLVIQTFSSKNIMEESECIVTKHVHESGLKSEHSE